MAWHATKHPGVTFRQHPQRKHGVGMDKYFAIYYQFDGKRYEEGLGWSSQGWTLDKAVITLAELKKAQQSGEGPVTLAEKRAIEKKRRESENAERKAQERDALTFADFFQNTGS